MSLGVVNNMTEQTALFSVREFKGLNNRIDPTLLGMDWQLEASGVLLDNASRFVGQPIPVSVRSAVDAYGARDGRLFVATVSRLYQLGANHEVLMEWAITGAPFLWAEVGTALFLQSISSTETWAIYPDRVVPWAISLPQTPVVTALTSGSLPRGTYLVAFVTEMSDGRLSGRSVFASATVSENGGLSIVAPLTAPQGASTRVYVSDPDGEFPLFRGYAPLTWTLLEPRGPVIPDAAFPPPSANVLGMWRNRVVVAVWEADKERSVIYRSLPDTPHLFDLRDFQLVAGRVGVIAEVPGGLVITTDRRIYIDAINAPVQIVAEYGAPFGSVVWQDDGRVLFWTDRGLCRAMPFENLTEKNLAPDVRGEASVAMLRWNGSEYALVATSNSHKSAGRTIQPHLPLTIEDSLWP